MSQRFQFNPAIAIVVWCVAIGCKHAAAAEAERYDVSLGCRLPAESVRGLTRADSSDGGTNRTCLERISDGALFATAPGLSFSDSFRFCSASDAARVIGAAACK